MPTLYRFGAVSVWMYADVTSAISAGRASLAITVKSENRASTLKVRSHDVEVRRPVIAAYAVIERPSMPTAPDPAGHSQFLGGDFSRK